jgi:hypothetical protein
MSLTNIAKKLFLPRQRELGAAYKRRGDTAEKCVGVSDKSCSEY